MRIEGLKHEELPQFKDLRGSFIKWYDKNLWEMFEVKQVNIVDNPSKGTIRGFHSQEGDSAEAKIVICLKGSILDVIYDNRKDSSTYGVTNSFVLSRDTMACLMVPKGCLHAYQVLEDNTLVGYLSDNDYRSEAEYGIRYDDPKINAPWAKIPVTISDKDANLPYLGNYA